MKIAITGATGYVASALVPLLKARGHEVVLFGRSEPMLRAKFPGDEIYAYNHFAEEVRACHAVLHTAVLNNSTAADEEEFRQVNAEWPVQLATQAAQAGVPLFINLTTTLAIDPKSVYGRSKLEGEERLKTVSGIHIIQLRLPAVYAGEYRGKLAVLNKVPRLLRRPLFALAAALEPTVSVDRITHEIDAALANPADALITDGQTRNFAYQFLQRAMDLAAALIILICFWWLLLLVMLLIPMSSEGPAVFTQPRVGRNGKIFICYKFRTMHTGVKQAGTHEVPAESVTKFGRILRRTRIDELPQLLNVLKGEMSLVGPRPCLDVQRELIEWRDRLGVFAVRPGITGLAQIRGVDMSDPEKLARLDAEYVARQGLLLDLKIILATISGRGANEYVATRSAS